MLTLLFSFQGRINRATWWGLTIATLVCGWVWATCVRFGLSVLVREVPREYWPTSYWLGFIAGFLLMELLLSPFIWSVLALSAKRFHDRNKSGLWTLISFVPIVGTVWIFVENGCLRGTAGPNKYGPDPLGDQKSKANAAPSVVDITGQPSPTSIEATDDKQEKYRLLIKYSETARMAEAGLSGLSPDLKQRFVREAVAAPDRVQEIANTLLAEHDKQQRPFGNERLDDLYGRLAECGTVAQAEFRRVIEFLGQQVDPEKVFIQIAGDWAEDQVKNWRTVLRNGRSRYVWNDLLFETKNELRAAILKRLMKNTPEEGGQSAAKVAPMTTASTDLTRRVSGIDAEGKRQRGGNVVGLEGDQPAGIGFCPGCNKPRAFGVPKCVHCGDTRPTGTGRVYPER